MDTPAERIRYLRMARSLSQRELTMHTPNVTFAYLSRIESGDRTPSIRAMVEIADALGTSALWLQFGEGAHVCPCCHTLVNVSMLSVAA